MVVTKYERDIVIKVICDYFNVTVENLKQVCRKREVVYKRQLAMYFLTVFTHETFVEIGKYFYKDHTTVIHAKTLIRNLIDIDESVRTDFEAIKVKMIEAYF